MDDIKQYITKRSLPDEKLERIREKKIAEMKN